MQEFGPISSRVYCIFSRTTNSNVKLSICSSYGWITQPQTCYWLFELFHRVSKPTVMQRGTNSAQ
jgi:hypothetical protein